MEKTYDYKRCYHITKTDKKTKRGTREVPLYEIWGSDSVRKAPKTEPLITSLKEAKRFIRDAIGAGVNRYGNVNVENGAKYLDKDFVFINEKRLMPTIRRLNLTAWPAFHGFNKNKYKMSGWEAIVSGIVMPKRQEKILLDALRAREEEKEKRAKRKAKREVERTEKARGAAGAQLKKLYPKLKAEEVAMLAHRVVDRHGYKSIPRLLDSCYWSIVAAWARDTFTDYRDILREGSPGMSSWEHKIATRDQLREEVESIMEGLEEED